MLKTQAAVRAEFWETHPEYKSEQRRGKRQNEYNATIRSSFVAFVDRLTRDGQISQKLAENVTL